MTSEARDGNTSDEDVAGDGLPDEPEMGSPWDNSPVHIEVAVSAVSLDNSPVNTVVAPSDMLLENQPEVCKMKLSAIIRTLKETSLWFNFCSQTTHLTFIFTASFGIAQSWLKISCYSLKFKQCIVSDGEMLTLYKPQKQIM